MTEILDCKVVAEAMKADVRQRVAEHDELIKLCIVTVGNDAASEAYVKGKMRDCAECGIAVEHIVLPRFINVSDLRQTLHGVNVRGDINAIIVQLPVPFEKNDFISWINPSKDVDCFTEQNIGKFYSGNAFVKPCTPAGICCLLDYYDIDVAGKNALVVGRSDIVGQPMAKMLTDRNATVTLAHSRTNEHDLENAVRRADIVVSAIGKPDIINPWWFDIDSIIIDVGINYVNGKMCGDIDTDNVKYADYAKYITPVPGGVGLLTRAQLMQNIAKVSGI